MVTFRHISEIEQQFDREQDIRLEIRASRKDVDEYLSEHTTRLSKCVERSQGLKATIMQTIGDRVDGM
jgi:hypothetical protein